LNRLKHHDLTAFFTFLIVHVLVLTTSAFGHSSKGGEFTVVSDLFPSAGGVCEAGGGQNAKTMFIKY
jgi:hypothetical protein